MKVLIIDPNRISVRDIHFCLKVRWSDVMVLSIAEGQKGIEMTESKSPDLVVVGPSLPDMETSELITKIRRFSHVPLIVLAQEQSDMDKVRFLEAGADDCINTPFSPIELLTKVRVLLRRTWGLGYNYEEDQLFSIGGLTVNAGTREVRVDDKPVKLTPIEFRLLLELIRNDGRVVIHEALLERVWGCEYVDDVGFLKRYVYRLRRKLEDRGKPLILSERGVGYRLLKSC